MNSGETKGSASHFARHMDQKLAFVLIELFRNSVLMSPPGSLSIERFLCGLYWRYPEETKVFFQNPSRFDELLPRFCPEPIKELARVSPEELASEMRQKLLSASGGPTAYEQQHWGLDLSLEAPLKTALLNSIHAASEAGHEKATLADFLRALSVDETARDQLCKSAGLVLKQTE